MEIKMPIDISCEELLSDQCTYCGWLRKEPVMKFFNWRKTYCVLSDRCFYYFKNESSKSPTGKFPLYGFNKIRRNMNEQVKWSFVLEHVQPSQKNYIFAASSQQEMVEWMKHIKEEMLRANNRGPRTTADGSSDGSGGYCPQDSIEKIEEKIYDEIKDFTPVHLPNCDSNDSDLDIDEIETMRPKYRDTLPRFKLPNLPKRSPGEGQPTKRIPYEQIDTIPVPLEQASSFPKKLPEKNYWESIYYHGDKDEATKIIEEIAQDGVYLVRDSDNVEAPKVLVTYSENERRVKKFQIFMNKNSPKPYYMRKELSFETVEELIYYYYHNNIVPDEIFKLTQPYLFAQG